MAHGAAASKEAILVYSVTFTYTQHVAPAALASRGRGLADPPERLLLGSARLGLARLGSARLARGLRPA